MSSRVYSVTTDILLRLRGRIPRGLRMKLGNYIIILDASLLMLAPVSIWAIATVYVPIIGADLNNFQAWAISFTILMLMLISLSLHSLGHIVAAKCSGSALPERIFLSPLGDPAQFRPAAPNAGKEALTALAGPLTQCLLAALFYALWNLQINTFINAVTFFLIFFNSGLMAFNLIPAFPFDGGRLLRAIFWRILGLPGLATRLALRAGWGISAGLVAWGIILIIQQARFSLETAAATFIISALIIVSLVLHKDWKWDRPEHKYRISLPATAIRSSLAVLLIFPLAAVTFSLVPLNEGLKAPGFTASVEPMVQLPPEYRYYPTGSLMLTTVIPQAPILFGEWIYAHLDRSISLEPQEKVVPADKTAQSVSQENYRMLQDSETTAIIAGLRLAGYAVEMNGDSSFNLPFPVKIVPQKVNGGPSAGLMFTLGVYNLVTEHDITGGRKIAGTGTIDIDGIVGPIGGVKQKVVAAERAGAEYFLSPAENYQDALAMARHITVIKVTTAQDAIDFLRGLPRDKLSR